jgi:hypothetical protein
MPLYPHQASRRTSALTPLGLLAVCVAGGVIAAVIALALAEVWP